MKLKVIIESAPEPASIYLGLALGKIDQSTNLDDAARQLSKMSQIGIYRGSNHIAIHSSSNGELVGNRLAIVTE